MSRTFLQTESEYGSFPAPLPSSLLLDSIPYPNCCIPFISSLTPFRVPPQLLPSSSSTSILASLPHSSSPLSHPEAHVLPFKFLIPRPIPSLSPLIQELQSNPFLLLRLAPPEITYSAFPIVVDSVTREHRLPVHNPCPPLPLCRCRQF